MALNALPLALPDRSIDDIVAERIRVTFGDESYVLPVRSIESNERFQAGMEQEIGGALAEVSAADDDLGAIFARLAPVAGRVLAFVHEYDETHVLPPLDELRRVARPLQAITAALEVWRAANPLADAGLVAAMQLGIGATRSPEPTNSPPRPTAGRSDGSGTNSPTNSSSSTSTPQPSGSLTPMNRASRRSARGRSSPTTGRPTNGGAPRSIAATGARPGSRVSH